MRLTHLDLLQGSRLLGVLRHHTLLDVYRQSDIIDFAAGDVIIREGDAAESVYVIFSGSVQVFVERADQIIVIRKLGAGEYFGEQAIVGGTARTSSVRAYDKVSLLRIRKHVFLDAIEDRKEVLARHRDTGLTQKITDQIFLALPKLAPHGDSDGGSERSFEDNQVVFREGTQPDGVYWILEGAADVIKEDAGRQVLVNVLYRGSAFGEQAVIDDSVRAATIRARGNLRTMFVPADRLLSAADRDELRDFFSAFLRSYRLPTDQGLVSQSVEITAPGRQVVVTRYDLGDGRAFEARLDAPGGGFTLKRVAPEADPGEVETATFTNEERHREVRVGTSGEILYLHSNGGDWQQAPELVRITLEGAKISAACLRQFERSGILDGADAAAEAGAGATADIVCHCANISRDQILEAVRAGAKTFQAIETQLGCATICGACRPSVQEIVGEDIWSPASLKSSQSLAPQIRSFQFVPSEPRVCLPSMPGQHIVIRADIDGVWVQRPYTLTSIAGDKHYEVCVKRESHGLFSRWLFESEDRQCEFQVSGPQGEFYWDPKGDRPIVCFVAGIGITPAIAILRQKLSDKNKAPAFVHYSVPDRTDAAFVAELQSSLEDPTVNVEVRDTRDHGRLTEADVRKVVADYRDATYFLCGPQDFMKAIEAHLIAAEIAPKQIRIEEFEHQGDQPRIRVDPEATAPPLAPGRIPVIGHWCAIRQPLVPYLLQHQHDYGPVMRLKIFGRTINVLMGEEAIRLLLEAPELFSQAKTFAAFAKMQMSERALMAHDGPGHRCMRDALLPLFDPDRLDGSSVSKLIDAATHYAAGLKPGDRLSARQLSPLTIYAFGAILHGIMPTEAQIETSIRLAESMQVGVSTFFPAYLNIAHLPQNIIKRYRAHTMALQLAVAQAETSPLLARLNRAVDTDGIPLSQKPDVVSAACLIPFNTGTESLANVVELGLFTILRDEQLAQEVDREVEEFFGRPLAQRNASDLRYIRAATYECLRRFPMVPGIPLNANDDISLAGRLVRKGDYLLVATSLVNFDADRFHDPMAFDWKRFLDDDPDFGDLGSFGIGAHACLAQNMVPSVISVLIATLLKQCDWDLLSPEFNFRQQSMLQLADRPVRLMKRK